MSYDSSVTSIASITIGLSGPGSDRLIVVVAGFVVVKVTDSLPALSQWLGGEYHLLLLG